LDAVLWQEKKIVVQQRQKLNDTPHVLSWGGYVLLEKWLKKSHVEALGLESPELVLVLPSTTSSSNISKGWNSFILKLLIFAYQFMTLICDFFCHV